MSRAHRTIAFFVGLIAISSVALFVPGALLALFSDTDVHVVTIDDLAAGETGSQVLALPTVQYDSFACMDATPTSDDEVSLTENEIAEGDMPDNPHDPWDGEVIDRGVVTFWWADDGDGIYEEEEQFLSGTEESPFLYFFQTNQLSVTLVSPEVNKWVEEGAIPAGAVRHVGMTWCMGEMGMVDGDLFCDGGGFEPIFETDRATIEVKLRMVQSRNNDSFSCGNSPATATLTVVVRVINDDGGDKEVADFPVNILDQSREVSIPAVSEVPVELNAGMYEVREHEDSGYTPSFSGDCDASGRVALLAGENRTCTITYDDIPPTLEECCSSVLFLPGVGGSRLYIPGRRGGMARVWEPLLAELVPFRSVTVSNLSLNEYGSSKRSDVTTRDIVDWTESLKDIYASFGSRMDTLKTSKVIKDWKAIPYDWRLSLDDILTKGNRVGEDISYIKATSSPFVVQELRRLASNSKTGKVTIIAHSNGGLVTKHITEMLGQDASLLIDKIIFVAVPHLGTPQGLMGILHGFGQGLGPGGILLSDANARTLGQNMPVAYNLLPSAGYFSSAPVPVITFDDSLPKWIERYGTTTSSFEGLQRFLTDTEVADCGTKFLIPCRVKPSFFNTAMPASVNQTLLSNANLLHSRSLDHWQPPAGVVAINIVGWGKMTLSQIKYKTATGGGFVRRGARDAVSNFFEPQYTINGDGTVVESSALWMEGASTRYWVNLLNYNSSTDGSYEHSTILSTTPVQDLLESIITESHVPLPDYISTISPGMSR